MSKRTKLNEPILAEGEVTGHAHRLTKNIDVYETDFGTREFELNEETTLVHEEHGVISLPAGDYTSGKVLEYDHFAEEARAVAD